MPTYEYRCKACGHELEIVQSFSDDALTTCPACSAESLRKVFAAPGITFKGSGFYKTDNRSSGSRSSTVPSSNGSSSSSSSSSAGESSSSSESTTTSAAASA